MASKFEYSFETQKAAGIKDEKLVLEYLAPNWEIDPASRGAEGVGIDYFLKHKREGRVVSIEIKSDRMASRTGNAFIETYSVYDSQLGWAHTCAADFLFYFLPYDRIIYVLKPPLIKAALSDWGNYPCKIVRNERWEGRGLLVPLAEISALATQFINLSQA
jgi:hypothetical protein